MADGEVVPVSPVQPLCAGPDDTVVGVGGLHQRRPGGGVPQKWGVGGGGEEEALAGGQVHVAAVEAHELPHELAHAVQRGGDADGGDDGAVGGSPDWKRRREQRRVGELAHGDPPCRRAVAHLGEPGDADEVVGGHLPPDACFPPRCRVE